MRQTTLLLSRVVLIAKDCSHFELISKDRNFILESKVLFTILRFSISDSIQTWRIIFRFGSMEVRQVDIIGLSDALRARYNQDAYFRFIHGFIFD